MTDDPHGITQKQFERLGARAATKGCDRCRSRLAAYLPYFVVRTAGLRLLVVCERCILAPDNAKARIIVYARAWSAHHRQPGQHRGPITRAFAEVLETLLWGFHNSRDGRCFPSYQAIATKAQCCRDTVYEALKVLESAGVLTWAHRITRIQVRERDLFGQWASRWRVIRTSNAYVFHDPQHPNGHPASKSENQVGTPNQEIQLISDTAPNDPDSPLERALARLGATRKKLLSNSGTPVPATTLNLGAVSPPKPA